MEESALGSWWGKLFTLGYNGVMLLFAIWKDIKQGQGSIKNTLACTAEITGRCVGGLVGYSLGSIIASFICPGLGPLIVLVLEALGVYCGSTILKTIIQNHDELQN